MTSVEKIRTHTHKYIDKDPQKKLCFKNILHFPWYTEKSRCEFCTFYFNLERKNWFPPTWTNFFINRIYDFTPKWSNLDGLTTLKTIPIWKKLTFYYSNSAMTAIYSITLAWKGTKFIPRFVCVLNRTKNFQIWVFISFKLLINSIIIRI